MIFTIYLRQIGVVSLNLNDVVVRGGNVYIVGHDEDGATVRITANKIKFNEDTVYDYGYCRITEYEHYGVKTKCNIYCSIG